MRSLKQSTAATVHLGPFVDKTDQVTPEAGLAGGTVDELAIYKHGATSAVDIRSSANLTHRAGGVYTVELSATDTNTAGHLILYARDDDVCLPVWAECMVLPANVYDALVAGADLLQVDIAQISGSSAAADNQEQAAKAIVSGQAVSGTLSITQMSTNLAEATDDHYNGRLLVFVSGSLLGQATDITDYTGSTKTLTFTALTEAPSAGDSFVIV